MCTRNGAPWLAAQLQSFLDQTHDAWSLWISDDGSTDDTRAVLDTFARANPGRIDRIVSGPGQGSAMNYIHLLCHPGLPPGPVALSDQDDVWLPGKLARAMAVLGADDTPRAWGARWFVTTETLENPRPSAPCPHGPSFGNALVQNVLSGHSVTLNAAALALVRRAGVQQVAHHDWWLYQLLAGAGAQITLDAAPALYYRQHGHNAQGANRGRVALASRMAKVRTGEFAAWSALHRAALSRNADLLTPGARALLLAFEAAPPRGLARLRAFRQMGLVRQTRATTAALYLMAAGGYL
jgi:glycosyltransferase involved in cell wall biosynthesis